MSSVGACANLHFTKGLGGEAPRDDEVWVAQFETPIAATEAILKLARAAGARTILNVARFVGHADRLMRVVDVAVLTEIELSQATGTKLRAASAVRDVAAACQQLRAKGARAVIATLGSRGAVVVTADGVTAIPAFKAKTVDTTGAGDCFVGALAARMSAGATPIDAARYASAAASRSVARLGPPPSMPTPQEVAARLARA